MDAQERAQALSRVIAFINDKGGVGKTSLTANLAGHLAHAGYRVLVIDLNRQANLADDLGYRENPDVDDDGAGLLTAISKGSPLEPVSGVRPGLDVVPGGVELGTLTPLLTARLMEQGRPAYAALGNCIAPIADRYDFIFVDSPPENIVLADLALSAARWIVMPTRTDKGGLVGMKLVAKRFLLAKEINPRLGLLGAVLFATGSGATLIQRRARDRVAEAFGGSSPMFTRTIRAAELVAEQARDSGRLAYELDSDESTKRQMAALKRGKTEPAKPAKPLTVTSVAGDYAALTAEMLTVLARAEAAA